MQPPTPAADTPDATPQSGGDQDGDESQPGERKQKNRSRCFECRKKVGLVGGFECKCGFVFCSGHRMPDEHACSFDWQGEARVRLAQENEVVKADKVMRF